MQNLSQIASINYDLSVLIKVKRFLIFFFMYHFFMHSLCLHLHPQSILINGLKNQMDCVKLHLPLPNQGSDRLLLLLPPCSTAPRGGSARSTSTSAPPSPCPTRRRRATSPPSSGTGSPPRPRTPTSSKHSTPPASATAAGRTPRPNAMQIYPPSGSSKSTVQEQIRRRKHTCPGAQTAAAASQSRALRRRSMGISLPIEINPVARG